jgi:predicted MFS family arabinose efflux permease
MGWHAAFMLVGAPGLILAAVLAFLKEPPRGGGMREEPHKDSPAEAWASLFRNRSFVINTLAMAAMTFALGGLAQWMPTFLYRIHHLDVARGNTLFGAITVVSGIAGTLTGGWLGDHFQKRGRRGYRIVSSVGFLLGTPIAAYAIAAPSLKQCLVATFLAEFFLFMNTGPLNTVLLGVARVGQRATAFAVNIFFIHALGDAISPTVLGWLSDRWGLQNALLTAPAAIAVAGVLCILCTRYIEGDMARADNTGMIV